jgi:hypothetical protein
LLSSSSVFQSAAAPGGDVIKYQHSSKPSTLAVIFLTLSNNYNVVTKIPKLFADFNNADQQGRVRLNTNGTFEDIKKLGLELKEGIEVLLDDNDSLTTIGKIKYSDEEKIWVAEISWDNIKLNDRLLDALSNSEVQKQLATYRQLLINAKSIETDKSFVKQYDDHLNTLAEIAIAVNHNNMLLLTKLIEQESRYYGWSYLPNDYGENVETAFWNLKKLIMDND